MDHARLAQLVSAGDAAAVAIWVRDAGLLSVQVGQGTGPGCTALASLQERHRARAEHLEREQVRSRSALAALDPLPRTIGIAAGALAVSALAVWLLNEVAIAVVAVAALVTGKLVWRPGRALQAVDSHAQDRDLLDACRRLIGLSFVEVAGAGLVENTPHRTLLAARRQDVHAAQRALQDKTATLLDLRSQVEQANRALDRTGPDPDLERLDQEQSGLAAQHRRLRALDTQLKSELERYEAGLDTLRAWARRAALTERLGRELDGGQEQAVLAAELEVDLLEVERSFSELEIQLGDADATLRTALELG